MSKMNMPHARTSFCSPRALSRAKHLTQNLIQGPTVALSVCGGSGLWRSNLVGATALSELKRKTRARALAMMRWALVGAEIKHLWDALCALFFFYYEIYLLEYINKK